MVHHFGRNQRRGSFVRKIGGADRSCGIANQGDSRISRSSSFPFSNPDVFLHLNRRHRRPRRCLIVVIVVVVAATDVFPSLSNIRIEFPPVDGEPEGVGALSEGAFEENGAQDASQRKSRGSLENRAVDRRDRHDGCGCPEGGEREGEE